MKQVRQGVFETNSSSTHSLVVCMRDDYNLLKEGKAYIMDEEVISREEVIKRAKANKWIDTDGKFDDEIIADMLSDGEINSLRTYGRDYETFGTSFTTPSGEVVEVFGYAGFDG